jgi:hypothetical protein
VHRGRAASRARHGIRIEPHELAALCLLAVLGALAVLSEFASMANPAYTGAITSIWRGLMGGSP